MRWILSGVMVFGGLLASTAALRGADHTKDEPAKVKEAVEAKKAVLIDVREKAEWDRGHLKDAKLLPLSSLQAGIKATDLAKQLPKNVIVYVHCASGFRCLRAAELLKNLGYEVRALKPGYKALLQAGFTPAPR